MSEQSLRGPTTRKQTPSFPLKSNNSLDKEGKDRFGDLFERGKNRKILFINSS